MHKQAINHKQAIIGGGYLFTENACYSHALLINLILKHEMLLLFFQEISLQLQ